MGNSENEVIMPANQQPVKIENYKLFIKSCSAISVVYLLVSYTNFIKWGLQLSINVIDIGKWFIKLTTNSIQFPWFDKICKL